MPCWIPGSREVARPGMTAGDREVSRYPPLHLVLCQRLAAVGKAVVMYGRPPLGKGFFGASACGSGAVIPGRALARTRNPGNEHSMRLGRRSGTRRSSAATDLYDSICG
jgi:hypothetical protein